LYVNGFISLPFFACNEHLVAKRSFHKLKLLNESSLCVFSLSLRLCVNNFFSQRRKEEQKALRTDVDSCLRSAYLFDGGDDAVISAAATDVAAHALAHA